MLATAVLLGLILVASTTDLWRHKIHNWTTYTGILIALGLSALGEVLLATTDVSREQLKQYLVCIELAESGLGLLAGSVLGFLVCGFLMLFCYVMFKIGGGDVKLIAMLGTFLGLEGGIEAMLWTFVLGGCMGLIVLICAWGRCVWRPGRFGRFCTRCGWVGGAR